MQKPAHIQFIIREKNLFCDRSCCTTVYAATHNMAYIDKGWFLTVQIIMIVTELQPDLLQTL